MTAQEIPRLWTGPFILICVAHFLLSFAFQASMPVFPLMLEGEFALKGLVLGAVAATYTASAILTRPPTGWLLDRFGRRVIYLPSYALFALCYFLYPLAEGAFSAGLVRFIHGAVWGVVMGAAATTSVDLLPAERRGEGIGYFGVGVIISMAAGPSAGLFLAETTGFGTLFIAAGFLTLLGFAILCFLRFPVIPQRETAFSVKALLEKTSLPASFAAFIYCVPYSAVVNYTGMFARTIPGASAGLFFLFLALGTGMTRIFSGKLFDTRGPETLMNIAYVLLLGGFLLQAAAQAPPYFYAAGMLLGLAYGIAVPVTQAMVNAVVPPERRGSANATFMTAFDLGICIGLMLTSALQAVWGWTAAYVLLAACAPVSWVVFRTSVLPRYIQASGRECRRV